MLLEPVARGLELHLLLGQLRRLLLEGCLLGLELGLLGLESRLLLLERRLLPLELVCLRRELLLLSLSLLLLLLELFLEALGLLHLLLELAARLCRSAELGCDQQRAVVAGAEARCHQVVRLPFRGGLRCRADVLLAEVQGEERDDQRDQDQGRSADGEPRVAGDGPGPRAPEPALRMLRLRPQERRHTDRLEMRADQREHRRQQGDCRQHCGDHRQGGRVAERRDERDPRDGQRDERDHHGAAREDDRGPGRPHGPGDRVVELHTFAQLVAVPADEEERIVDADAEPDHRRERRGDRRNAGDVAEQPDQGQAGGQADDCGHDRHAHGDEGTEREREDDHGGEEADRIAAPGVRLGQLGADRAPDGDLHPCLQSGVSGVEDVLRDLLGQLVAADVEQDGDVRGLAVLADQGCAALAERAGGGVDVGQLHDLRVRRLDRLLVLLVGDLARARVEDERVAAVLLRGERGGKKVCRLLASRAGKVHVVTGVRAERVVQANGAGKENQPRAENDPLVVGREPADMVKELRHPSLARRV